MPEDNQLRDEVAAQLDALLRLPEWSARGPHASVTSHANFRRGQRTPARQRLWSEMTERYLSRQPDVAREGRAAVLTAGAPGAGKSHAIDQLGGFDQTWRRIDADIVKDYLVEDLAASGQIDVLLGRALADARPVMPAELAVLVHVESVAFIDEIRRECLVRGENVVIEGTLSWPPAAQHLLRELLQREYREVTIVDVEVTRQVAHEQARARWWHGRLDAAEGHSIGGRFVPGAAIDHVFPRNAVHSVCMNNVRAAFDSDLAKALPVVTLQVLDSTGQTPRIETHERHGRLLRAAQAPPVARGGPRARVPRPVRPHYPEGPGPDLLM